MARFEHEDGLSATFDESAEDLFENAPCGYLTTRPDGTLLQVNETFLRWTGFAREELVGVRRFQDLLSVGGRIFHETHYAPMLRMQGSAREIAVDVVGADGKRLPVLVNSVLVRDAGGAPQAIRTTVVDATERKLYERELLAARDRERESRERAEAQQLVTQEVAHTLQRSLLADALPRDPRFEIATDYRPAIEHLEVGGDWYDAFELPGGDIGVVVGDVVGRGLSAASTMGQLRSAVRALAGAGCSPGQVLQHLDTFVEQVVPARYATLVVAEVSPGDGTVTAASAGHLPLVTFGPEGEPELFMEGRSVPLGVSGPGFRRDEGRFTLPPGGGFLVYTDGLVERRTEPIFDGLDRLLAAVRDTPLTSAKGLVRRLPELLLEADAVQDDVCLLAFRRCG